MAKKRPTGKGAAQAAPLKSGGDESPAEDVPWAINPIPVAVTRFLELADLSPITGLDPISLADAFEVFNSTSPSGVPSPAEDIEAIQAVVDASRKLRVAVARLPEFAIGEMMRSGFGPRDALFETWWRGVDGDLRELESGLRTPALRALSNLGHASKKPKLEARDRLFRAVFMSLSSEFAVTRRVELAADILEAAGIAVPADTGGRRRLLRPVLPGR